MNFEKDFIDDDSFSEKISKYPDLEKRYLQEISELVRNRKIAFLRKIYNRQRYLEIFNESRKGASYSELSETHGLGVAAISRIVNIVKKNKRIYNVE